MLIRTYTNRLVLGGYRPGTIAVRSQVLRSFEASLAGRPLAEATRLDLESFLARPLAPESRRAYRSHLRAFYMWALDEGFISTDPTIKLPAIRVPRAMPRPVSTDQLVSALDAAGARMRAWLLLMALGGLRCMEVAWLRPQDLLVTDAGVLLFLRECKGGGSATVPAHPAILDALAVVPVRSGLWWDCGPVSVSRQVGAHLIAVGVDATAHQLRHFAGTAWYRASGHDLLTTQQLMRHATVASTQIYAQTDPTRPAEVVGQVPVPDGGGLGSAA